MFKVILRPSPVLSIAAPGCGIITHRAQTCICDPCCDLIFSSFQDFKIQNIVGSCDVKFPIRLEGLAYSHSFFCSVSSHTFEPRICAREYACTRVSPQAASPPCHLH